MISLFTTLLSFPKSVETVLTLYLSFSFILKPTKSVFDAGVDVLRLVAVFRSTFNA